MSCQVECSNLGHVLLRHFRHRSHQRHPGSSQGIAADVGGSDQQAGALVAQEILGMHGHGTDEKNRPASIVQPIGHQ